jgi:predicted Rossmann fold flavoprotein
LPKSGSDGSGYVLARKLGHSLVETTPALVPLVLEGDSFHSSVSGVAHDAELTLWLRGRAARRIRGPLLWTHFGISGPAALNASRHWARAQLEKQDPKLTVSFCPGEGFDQIDERLITAGKERPKALPHTALALWLPESVARSIVERLNIAEVPLSQLPRDDRRRLARALVEWPLPVVATRGYTYAEATAGGVPLDEIDPASMASRICPGLYLVGEILDVDGRLGGFNFQWAWASAYVAARALAARHTNPQSGRNRTGMQ